MATLILTAAGTAIGGPIGGAIGSAIGQFVDQTVLFAPKPRQGPRLGDLAVQTSSYGSPIPRIFGSMRVAGTVIWSTDLIESRSATGGGKGRPRTVSYAYSASFAVALSARPIRSVGRIWADGKLLRGGAGDFKAATSFRLYDGDEDQPVDPLIASAEGVAQTSAFRGIAYAMFENLKLEDFGNRIPSLTFEVEADPAPVSLGAIAVELSGGEVAAQATPSLGGYAALGDNVRAAIEALADVVPISLADRDGALRLAVQAPPPTALAVEEGHGRHEIVRQGASTLPDEVSLAYYEPARDYQAGLQRATSEGSAVARRPDRRALPAALSAEAAKALAEFRLSALRAGRATAKIRLGWARCGLRPGDAVAIEGESGTWLIRRWTLGPMTVELELQRVSGEPLPNPVAASAGQPVREPDLRHGPTLLRLFELPIVNSQSGRAQMLVAAAGEEPGWRRAELLASFDGGSSWEEVGGTALPAVIGEALTALAPAGSTLLDARSTVDIELANDAMWLESVSDEALANGANLALLGSELIQFGSAEGLGGRRFRLSRLLRGRRGSEWAAGSHISGEGFTLVEARALLPIELPEGVGGEARISATGVGDGVPATGSLQLAGEALRPPSPVHLRGELSADGDIRFHWVRRSRQGWSWQSESDTPLGEEAELYRIAIAGTGFERVADTSAPGFVYSADDQAADGATLPLEVTLIQVGTFAASRPAMLIFS